jgi:hypothetical protein
MITRKAEGKNGKERETKRLGLNLSVKTGAKFVLEVSFRRESYIPAARLSIYSCRSCHPVAKEDINIQITLVLPKIKNKKKWWGAYLRQHGP